MAYNVEHVTDTVFQIGEDLHFTSGTVAWILTGYTLTFGAFQVPAGRLSDIYHPKPIFCLGFFFVGIFSILCAVSVHPIMLIVFRAMSGLAAAMTVPSAISILVQTFPDPKEKSDILGIFGAMGAIGNCAGIVIGGVLAGSASWRWVFYLIAIAVIPFAILSAFLVPKNVQAVSTTDERRSLDLPGISVLTAALILFVYAISDGNTEGWGSPQIITTLVLSVILFVAFFVIERISKDPALPPSTWSNKNFTPMFFYAWR
jgi:MFS family permease